MTETPLSVHDLTEDELQLLIGLLIVAVNADDIFSAAEEDALKQISAEIGQDRVLAATKRLRERYPDQQSIRDAASSVTRSEARLLIWELVAAVCEVDGLVRQEESLLAWLSKAWELETPQRA